MGLDRWLLLRALSVLVLCGGCNALLGIEALKAGPAAGSASQSGGSGTSAKHDTGGAGAGGHVSGNGSEPAAGSSGDSSAPAAGSGGSAGHASGDSSGSGGAGGVAAQAGHGSGGSGTAGTAGNTAGAGGAGGGGGVGAPSITVTGKVIDYYRHLVPGATVRIGDITTRTNARGEFTLANVATPYDVVLTINTSVSSSVATVVWRVEGLNRRDPTLQVYRALSDRSSELFIHIKNVAFPLVTNQRLVMTWSGVDGAFTVNVDTMDTDYLSAYWFGPSMTQGNAHALLFNDSPQGSIPTDYLAYDVHPVAMVENMNSDVTFDLTSATRLSTGAITGSVTGVTTNDRANLVYLRFADNASFELVDDTTTTTSFSYQVPSVAGASLTVVATNEIGSGGLAAAYADNLGASQARVALDIPAMPILVAPAANKSNVDGSTLFQWSTDAKVSLFCAHSMSTYDEMCVVTGKQETKLPIGPLAGYTPAANADLNWSVETHGAYATVDEASSDGGFLSAFAYGVIRGPQRGNGTYAESGQRTVKTAPQ
jgi:hypothetical protein